MEAAVALGIPSVMFDASKLPYADNVRATRAVVDAAHARGVWVEAELGEIGGKDGVHAPGARTDPAEAAAYVAATGVDAVAVAVGTSHAMTTRGTRPWTCRSSDACARRCRCPLVLHGSSGVPDDELGRAIEAGMTKINIATHLNHVYTDAVRAWLAANPAGVDPRALPGCRPRRRRRGGHPAAGGAPRGLTGGGRRSGGHGRHLPCPLEAQTTVGAQQPEQRAVDGGECPGHLVGGHQLRPLDRPRAAIDGQLGRPRRQHVAHPLGGVP